MSDADRITTIEPRTSWRSDLLDILTTANVGALLAWRNVLVVYKQTFFGVAWALIRPAAMTLVLAALYFRGRGGGGPLPSTGLFLLAGVIPMQFFVQCVANVGDSLLANSNVITKVYFPKIWVMIAATAQAVADLLVAVPCLVAGLCFFGPGVSLRLLALPLLVVFALLASLSVSLPIAIYVVRYRDIKHALPFALQLAYFVGPVAYDSSTLEGPLKWAVLLFPATGLVEAFRWACFSELAFPATAVAVSLASTAVLSVAGLASLRRFQASIVDRL